MDDPQLDQLEISFAEMRNAGWNPDADLLWGCFFVDSDSQRLKRNSEFTNLASEFGVRAYDGWDVGKAVSLRDAR